MSAKTAGHRASTDTPAGSSRKQNAAGEGLGAGLGSGLGSGLGLRVGIKQLDHAGGLALPTYQSSGAAGLDLIAAVPAKEPVVLAPGERKLLPTGLVMEIPEGFEAQVRPRSGLALKHGITILNTPGTIDADYRGEIGVILYNAGSEAFQVARGDRIAQLVFAPVAKAVLVVVDTVSETGRGDGGFGSTGASAKTSPHSAKHKKPKRSARIDGPGMSSAKPADLAKKTRAKAKPRKKAGKSGKASRQAN